MKLFTLTINLFTNNHPLTSTGLLIDFYFIFFIFLHTQSEFDEDDDIDGELRPPIRRFSFGVSSRRSSVVSTSAISIPTRFNVSPPNLLARRSIIPTSSPEPSSSPERIIKEETV